MRSARNSSVVTSGCGVVNPSVVGSSSVLTVGCGVGNSSVLTVGCGVGSVGWCVAVTLWWRRVMREDDTICIV